MPLLDLNQAAQLLGISSEKLVEMRERNEIHGYRDGASWKFKEDEVQRVKAELAENDPGESVLPIEDDDLGSILVSEEELGASSDGSKSTIIGKTEGDAGADSDIQLAAEDAGSDLNLMADSGLGLNDTGTGSDLELTPSADTGTGSNLELEPSAGTGDLDLASDLNFGSDPLELGDDDDLELSDDDDDLVLGGSGGLESDITLGSADTGINLTSPSDSGLSLEEAPLDLGSSISSLELPEDDDILSVDEMGEDAVQPDDEFMLSQPDDNEDDDDSGSQVIALEESAAFDQDAATMLGDGEAALLSEDPALEPSMDAFAEMPDDALGGAGFAAAGVDAAMSPASALGPQMTMPASQGAPEKPYTVLNVLWLMTILMVLSLSGMLIIDVVRNMWSWNETASASTSITDGIVSALGLSR